MEHKPGKPKDVNEQDVQSFVELHIVPKLPPGKVCREPEATANHMKDAKSYSSQYNDDSDDTYLDAAEMFSRSESFFFNCSNVSGHGVLVEPFGTLSRDRKTQDLMMERFLHAANALTSETLLARKPPKPEELERQMSKKVVVVKEKQNKTGRWKHEQHSGFLWISPSDLL